MERRPASSGAEGRARGCSPRMDPTRNSGGAWSGVPVTACSGVGGAEVVRGGSSGWVAPSGWFWFVWLCNEENGRIKKKLKKKKRKKKEREEDELPRQGVKFRCKT